MLTKKEGKRRALHSDNNHKNTGINAVDNDANCDNNENVK